VRPEVLKQLLSSGEIAAASQVLEVGCGTGNYIIAIEQATGCQGWGIDPSAEMLARARARSCAVSFRPGRGEKLALPGRHFDLVFSVDVIHHNVQFQLPHVFNSTRTELFRSRVNAR